MWWSALLVVIAVSAAGLTAKADQPQDSAHRPELSRQADADMASWLPMFNERLTAVDERVFDVSSAGQDLLGDFFTLDTAAAMGTADTAAAAGTVATGAVEEATLARDQAYAAFDPWRLSEPNRDQLSLIETAIASAERATAAWSTVIADARLAAPVLDPLALHDETLTNATNAGIEARWQDALDAIDACVAPLDEAALAVGGLPQSLDKPRLEALVAAYRRYDDALRALYEHILETGSMKGPDVEELVAAVDEAQADVPEDRLALGEMVVGALGQPLTDAVTALEEARADIFDALPGDELQPDDGFGPSQQPLP